MKSRTLEKTMPRKSVIKEIDISTRVTQIGQSVLLLDLERVVEWRKARWLIAFDRISRDGLDVFSRLEK